MIIKEEANIHGQHYTDQEGKVVFKSSEVFLVSRESWLSFRPAIHHNQGD